MSSVKTEVVDITPANVAEAADICAQAFENFPIMRWVFQGLEGAAYQDMLRVFLRFGFEFRFPLGWPTLGLEVDGRLIGAGGFDNPILEEGPLPPEAQAILDRFLADVGDQAAERFGRWAELTDSRRPKEPHHYATFGGALPDYQRRGFGAIVHRRFEEMAAADPISVGIALDTETDENVEIWKRIGYEVTSTGKLDDITVTCMFKRIGR